MKMKKIAFYLLAALMGGCIPTSLHPLYTEKELVFEEKLLGVWIGTDDEGKWEFEKFDDPNFYKLTVTDNESKAVFAAHLVELDEMLFLDIGYGQLESSKSCWLWQIQNLPSHIFLKVEQIEPTLQMRAMELEFMKKMLESDPNIIKHEIVDDERIVLTASTKELQEFMKKHANDEGLFDDAVELKRLDPNDTDPNKIDPNDKAKEEQVK